MTPRVLAGEVTPLVLAGERRSGRTTTLLRWLRAGSPIDWYPGWSRLLVCAHERSVPETYRMAMDLFGPGPWGKCIVSVHDLRSAYRGGIRPGHVEIAIDDVDALLGAALGVPQAPALLTLVGNSVDADELGLPPAPPRAAASSWSPR